MPLSFKGRQSRDQPAEINDPLPAVSGQVKIRRNRQFEIIISGSQRQEF
jgi:hypothetical protein